MMKTAKLIVMFILITHSIVCMDTQKQVEALAKDPDILRFLGMKEDRLQDLQRRVKNKLIQNYLQDEGKELAQKIDTFDAKLPGYQDQIEKKITTLSLIDKGSIRGFLLEITNIKDKFQHASELIP